MQRESGVIAASLLRHCCVRGASALRGSGVGAASLRRDRGVSTTRERRHCCVRVASARRGSCVIMA